MTLIATVRKSGGRSKDCRVLLQTLGMCVSKNLDDGNSVLLEAIYWQIFSAISWTSAKRIMEKAGKKRKRFREEELSNFP